MCALVFFISVQKYTAINFVKLLIVIEHTLKINESASYI